MTNPENVQDVRIKRSMLGAPPPKDLAAPHPHHAAHPTAQPPAEAAAPRTPRDRWMIALTVGGLCVLAGLMAIYILIPAITTLADPSTLTWTGEGP